MYKMPISFKEYKKRSKYHTKKTQRYRERSKLNKDTEKLIVFETFNDLYLYDTMSKFDYIILCIDVYNNLTSLYSKWLIERYSTLLDYELSLPYGDQRRMGTINIVKDKDKKDTNLILFTVDNGSGKIDRDSIVLCFKRLKDIIPNKSSCICNIYGSSNIWEVKYREEFTNELLKVNSELHIHFFKESIREESVYKKLVNDYLDNRIKYTIFDEDFSSYLNTKKTRELILQKLNLVNSNKNGTKKDKFDF